MDPVQQAQAIESIVSKFNERLALRQRPLVTTSASTNPLPPLAPAVSLAKRTQIHTRLASELDRVAIYDRIELQDIAREQIPVDRLHEAANKCISSVSLSSTSFQEELLKQLLTWFKADYFSWVDNLSCESCGSTSTRAVSPSNGPSSLHTGPTAEDIKHGAHRVELYQCSHCNSISRFPRYNDPVKLMQTRRGRCGEWANVFTLFAKTMGFEARYVLDFTDHVWTEVYIERTGKWAHCDSCEAAYNTPLIYEVGWGKQLSFVFSFGTHQVVDTTRRYARKQEVYIRRRGTVDEEGLVMIIKSLNSKHQAHLSSTARQQLLALEIAEEQDLKELFATKMASVDDFKTRQSGSLEWRSLRGEMGNTGNGGGGGGGTGSLSFADFSSSVPVFSCLFDKHQDLCLNGSAQLQQPPPSPLTSQDQLQQQRSVILEITPAANDQRGSVFLRNYKLGIVSSSSSSSADHQQELFLKCLDNNNTTITNSSSFSFEFIFRMTNAQGVSANGNGADGMAFVLQAASPIALGQGGSGMGYQGIRKCVAVEMDIYKSADTCADPCGNHVSIQTGYANQPCSPHHGYSIACTPTNTLPPLNDGRFYAMRVKVSSTRIQVFFTDKINQSRGEQYLQILDAPLDLARVKGELQEAGSDEFWIGFTAATGGLNQRHEVAAFSIDRE